MRFTEDDLEKSHNSLRSSGPSLKPIEGQSSSLRGAILSRQLPEIQQFLNEPNSTTLQDIQRFQGKSILASVCTISNELNDENWLQVAIKIFSLVEYAVGLDWDDQIPKWINKNKFHAPVAQRVISDCGPAPAKTRLMSLLLTRMCLSPSYPLDPMFSFTNFCKALGDLKTISRPNKNTPLILLCSSLPFSHQAQESDPVISLKEQMTEILLNTYEVDPNVATSVGNTALILAAWKASSPKIVEMLLKAGADPLHIEPYRKNTALSLSAFSGCLSIVQMIAKHPSVANNPSYLNQKDAWGRTALHQAYYRGHKHVAEFLESMESVHKDIVDNFGWKPRELIAKSRLTSLPPELIKNIVFQTPEAVAIDGLAATCTVFKSMLGK
jgi:hypothetical protein